MQPQKRKTTQAQKTSKKKKSNPLKPKTSRAPLAKSNKVTTPGRTTRIKHRELITSAMYPPAEWDLKVSELINPGNPLSALCLPFVCPLSALFCFFI